MPSALFLKPAKAVALIAESDDAASKSPAQLRMAAKGWRHDATRLESIAAGRKRRNQEQRVEAMRLRARADVVCIAASEIERRGADSAAAALTVRYRLVGFVKRIARRG